MKISTLPSSYDLYTDDGGTVFRWWKDREIAIQLIDLFPEQRREALQEFLEERKMDKVIIWHSKKDRSNVWMFI